MSARADIETAIAATAERVSPGSGDQAARDSKPAIEMIAGSSDATIRRFATGELTVAARVVFESKHPDGDPVTFDKQREGVIALFPEGLVFVRAMALGALESKALGAGDMSVEKVTCVLNGAEVPGLRIAARSGKPTFAVAVGHAPAPDNASGQTAVRDEIYDLLRT